MINYCSYEEKDQDQMYEVFYELTKEEVFFKELTKEAFKNRLFNSPAFKKEGTFVAKDNDVIVNAERSLVFVQKSDWYLTDDPDNPR